jgi:hypothetical protein
MTYIMHQGIIISVYATHLFIIYFIFSDVITICFGPLSGHHQAILTQICHETGFYKNIPCMLHAHWSFSLWRVLSSGTTPCSLLKANQRFGESYRLNLYHQRISQAGKHHGACIKQDSSCFSETLVGFQLTIARVFRRDRPPTRSRRSAGSSGESSRMLTIQAFSMLL